MNVSTANKKRWGQGLSNSDEIWRLVPEFDKYEVSNLGTIRNIHSKICRKISSQLSIPLPGGGIKSVKYGKLVASAWLDIPLNSDEYCLKFKDGNCYNFNLNNLEAVPLVYVGEIWKPVKYCPQYSVSNSGRVRRESRIDRYTRSDGISCTRPVPCKILTPSVHDGYLEVNLYTKSCNIYRCVHRLVAEAFLPNPNQLPQVNHKNGDKRDNRIENLEWVTSAQNIAHAINTGLRQPPPKGVRRGPVKVKCTETGQTWDTIKACADALHISQSYLYDRINKNLPCHGYHFEKLKEE